MLDTHRYISPVRAFTLIELLVVVAIISILSAIAVPNFLEAQTRAKVSRVKNDQRAMVTALESYAVDHNKYPPRAPAPNIGNITPSIGDVAFWSQDLSRLTTPVSYMTTVPVDIFENSVAPPYNLIDYWDVLILRDWVSTSVNDPRDHNLPSRGGQWALVSVGPDQIMNLRSTRQEGSGPTLGGDINPGNSGIYHDYDPTNGTISDGNIYRFQIGERHPREVLVPDI